MKNLEEYLDWSRKYAPDLYNDMMGTLESWVATNHADPHAVNIVSLEGDIDAEVERMKQPPDAAELSLRNPNMEADDDMGE